jgi:hypothetical protein
MKRLKPERLLRSEAELNLTVLLNGVSFKSNIGATHEGPPREIAKSFSANGMVGRGGGDRTRPPILKSRD